MPIQWFDVLLILVMLISAFLAMRRGLVQEMLSLVSWAIAALIALFFYQLYRERVRALFGSQLLADIVLVLAVFLLTLLILSIVIPYLFTPPPDNAVNRTLGFVYGLVRGLILVVIAYELIAATTPRESLPRWVTEARSLPLIERTGRAILSLLPDNPDSIFRSSEAGGALAPRDRRAGAATGTTQARLLSVKGRVTIFPTAG